MCEEFSQCYNDTNICLWTDKWWLNQSAAQTACQQRNSFLPRVTNRNVQSKLRKFRFAASDLLHNSGFWIDVKAVDTNDWHWIDGSSFPGRFICCRTHTAHARLLCIEHVIASVQPNKHL